MSLVLVLALPFVASALATLLPATGRNRAALLAGAAALSSLAGLALYWPKVVAGEVVVERMLWVPALGLNLTLRLDGFAWAISMLVLGIGALVVLYTRYYLSATDSVPRFFAFFLAFMGAMTGVVLAGNLLQLVFFWELTSLFSFLLIGYWYQRKDAQRGARLALTITGVGGLCLLAGVLVIGHIVGSYELDVVLTKGDLVRSHPLYLAALTLVLLGAFTKSAQFPFHFWLPRAMAAPTPVSVYLHSATMVKAGVFLLARLWPVLSGTEVWFWVVSSVGVVTLLLGAYLALFQHDLKAVLAYSTISHLGLITLLLGLDSPLGAVAAVFHLMNHAAFKASLFMSVGIIDHETGTRDLRKLSGLLRFMPITATLAMVASAAMAGVPLMNGFLSKEMFFAETLFITRSPIVEWTLPALAALAGMGSVAYSLRLCVEVFFGPPAKDLPHRPGEPPFFMRAPVGLLVLLCVVVGVAPQQTVGTLLEVAARPVVGGTLPEYSLAVWHGFNRPLVMSIVALIGGTLGFRWLRTKDLRAPLNGAFDGKRRFEQGVAALTWFARETRKTLLRAGLQGQLFWMVAVVVGIGLLAPGVISAGTRDTLPLSPGFGALWLVGGTAALGAAWQAKYHRLAALMLAGVAGVASVVTFSWFSAPDLALTQLVVEVVNVVLVLLGLRWLPALGAKHGVFTPRTRSEMRVRRGRDLVVAIAGGTSIALVAWALMTRPAPTGIANFFLERALPEGGGRNVVNVILVDFRGFDTFGEGVVLALVALTVYALLRRFRPASATLKIPVQQRALAQDLQTDLVNPRHARDTAIGYLMVPAVLVRLLLPASLMIAAYLFLRGHHEPGGGFVAGLTISIGLLIQYIVSGTEWTEQNLRINPRMLIVVGLLLVLGTAAAPLVLGRAWLTAGGWHGVLPVVGEVHLSSVIAFDLGVFTLVVGATLLILTSIAHQSVRADRETRSDD